MMAKLNILCQNEDEFFEYSFWNEELLKEEAHFIHVRKCEFQNCVFDAVIFHEVNITECIFRNCKFLNTSFFSSTFQKNQFYDCDFVNSSFSESKLEQNKWFHSLFKYSEIKKVEMDVEVFENCDFIQTFLTNNKSRDVLFSVSRFDSCDLTGTFLDTNFSSSILKDTKLSLTDLKNCILTPSQGLELLTYYGISFHE